MPELGSGSWDTWERVSFMIMALPLNLVWSGAALLKQICVLSELYLMCRTCTLLSDCPLFIHVYLHVPGVQIMLSFVQECRGFSQVFPGICQAPFSAWIQSPYLRFRPLFFFLGDISDLPDCSAGTRMGMGFALTHFALEVFRNERFQLTSWQSLSERWGIA